MAEFTPTALALVGDADPLEIQAQLVPAITELLRGIADEDLERPEAAGKWSLHEVVEHLVDAEIVHSYRFRMILEHEPFEHHAYDPALWGERGNYSEGNLSEAIALLRLLRSRNLRLLRSLDAGDLERTGIHGRRGEEKLHRMIVLVAGHDLVHRRQIERIRASLGTS